MTGVVTGLSAVPGTKAQVTVTVQIDQSGQAVSFSAMRGAFDIGDAVQVAVTKI